jgi:hypothetical protein
MPYEIKMVGTYYTVRDKETDKKHSEHSTHDKAKAQLAFLDGIEKGTVKSFGKSRLSRYKGKNMIGSVMSSTGR